MNKSFTDWTIEDCIHQSFCVLGEVARNDRVDLLEEIFELRTASSERDSLRKRVEEMEEVLKVVKNCRASDLCGNCSALIHKELKLQPAPREGEEG